MFTKETRRRLSNQKLVKKIYKKYCLNAKSGKLQRKELKTEAIRQVKWRRTTGVKRKEMSEMGTGPRPLPF